MEKSEKEKLEKKTKEKKKIKSGGGKSRKSKKGTKSTPSITTTPTTIETVIKEYRRPGGRRLTAIERSLCEDYRRQGYTIYETAQKLDCDPSTVCYWCKRIKYGTSNRKYIHLIPAEFNSQSAGTTNPIMQFTTITGQTYNILKF